jgi:hypothetical protein
MHKTRICITLVCCLFALTALAWTQNQQKPGLSEITSTMTWQKSPLPAGITLPAGIKSPFSGTTTTTQVCYTQAMIDKYGAPVAQPNKDCQITNIVKGASSMTADMVCSGKMNGKGELESSWPTSSVTKGKMHFSGSMASGSQSMPVEWTIEYSSVYKGPDCGSVKPIVMPTN